MNTEKRQDVAENEDDPQTSRIAMALFLVGIRTGQRYFFHVKDKKTGEDDVLMATRDGSGGVWFRGPDGHGMCVEKLIKQYNVLSRVDL